MNIYTAHSIFGLCLSFVIYDVKFGQISIFTTSWDPNTIHHAIGIGVSAGLSDYEEDQIISRVMVAQIKTHQKDKNGTKSCKNGVQNALENIWKYRIITSK